MKRLDERSYDALRDVTIEPNYLKFADGSVLIKMGHTHVICSATVEDSVPPFMRGNGTGWVTAEYSMLPASSPQRVRRESSKGKVGGRTHEIQRLIGRSLRTVTDMDNLGERTIYLDCDVIQADGGTRTASITGAYVALALALNKLRSEGVYEKIPLIDSVSAISVGIVKGAQLLDLNYPEDSAAEVDMNVIITGRGEFIEVQGTAETKPFSKRSLDGLLEIAGRGTDTLRELQVGAIKNGISGIRDSDFAGNIFK